MRIVEMLKHFPFVLLIAFALITLVHTQDQTGFISLDCGLPKNSFYTERRISINYISDAPYIETGVSKSISTQYDATLQQQLEHVRSFPQGKRNCYKVGVKSDTKYLIRADFLYGNYDGLNKLPKFDLYLGVNFWDSVTFDTEVSRTTKEIIHISLKDYLHVCLVNNGSGTPFISALEFRHFPNDTYVTQSGSLALAYRWDTGTTSNQTYRYPYDVLDRLWYPYSDNKWTKISSTGVVDSQSNNGYQPPSIVMNSASTSIDVSAPMRFYLVDSDTRVGYYVYMHFAELQQLKANESRSFNITLNGELWYSIPVVPDYMYTITIYSPKTLTGGNYTFQLIQLENSTLPPILNAIEIYTLKDFSRPETDPDDMNAITSIKTIYGVNKNWQGDPCLPVSFLWAGLNCSHDFSNARRIVSLNLSSSGLSGEITQSIADLTMLESLDFSNNNFTGQVPDFLSELEKLKFLNLEGNKFTGTIPSELIERSENGLLTLRKDENISSCRSSSCNNNNKKKKNNIVIPAAASVGGVVIFLLIAAAIISSVLKQNRKQANVTTWKPQNESFESKKRQFTYAEVVKMTNNFDKILGKGGFGTVYQGFIDHDTQVAVKMPSPSSVQGYQQFQAEVRLLMRVHHKNLTSLVGYCNEGTNMALIYEYMANGNLDSHLADGSSANVLSWEGRLQIALDSAQGLEYLHNGCKPPIVHRDVKTTNILLTENFQAKLADFGLSKIFPADGSTHVSTVVAGTPGYLDPDYYITNRLNEKSDVYSFGVVLLEIVTGRTAISNAHEKTHVSQWVSFMLVNGDIKSIADPRLRGDFEINSVWKLVEMGMACVCPTPSKRPNMSQVVTELKECLATEMGRRNVSCVADSSDSAEAFSMTINTEIIPLAR